jgi:K+-sensing histidine kinase KdpD
VGIVETHGRQETALLLEGLEILPLKEIPHRDRLLREFDLDGALVRRPALILVDELAHSNRGEFGMAAGLAVAIAGAGQFSPRGFNPV